MKSHFATHASSHLESIWCDWQLSKETRVVPRDTQVKLDAVVRAHGDHVTVLNQNWVSLLEAFKIRYGARLYDNVLLAFSHFEHQQAEQEALMPDPSRQLALNLGSAHAIHTKRRFVSTMPITTEDLRV